MPFYVITVDRDFKYPVYSSPKSKINSAAAELARTRFAAGALDYYGIFEAYVNFENQSFSKKMHEEAWRKPVPVLDINEKAKPAHAV